VDQLARLVGDRLLRLRKVLTRILQHFASGVMSSHRL
jgi:hypothetical protein